MNNLAKNITALRKRYNYTQEDISKLVFVSRQAISKWERGETSPDIDTLIALANLYGVNLDTLIEGNEFDKDVDTNNNMPQKVAVPNAEELKKLHTSKLIKNMLWWAFWLFGIYALVCGIIQSAFIDVSAQAWLVWFTLPIVPPLIFALRFRHDIRTEWLTLFVNVPFISGLLFLIIVQIGNPYGAWIAFLLIPVYYALVIAIIVIKTQQRKKSFSKI